MNGLSQLPDENGSEKNFPMSEKCTKCLLSCGGVLNNSEGWGNPNALLAILLDCPGNALAEKLLIWILRRLSLTSNDVWIDYFVKCPLPKKALKALVLESYKTCWNHIIRHEVMNAQAVVVTGNWGCDLLTSAKMKDLHGRKCPETNIWVCYSFKYLLMNPSECVDNSRVIYKAAEEVGLSPKIEIDVPAFKFPPRKLT